MASRCVRVGAAAVVAMAILSGCSGPASPQSNVPAAPATPQSSVPVSPATTTAEAVPFSLLTHCGIHEAQVQGSFFVADQPLDDGQGNPPAGWGNPYQPGTIAVEGQKAVFHDDRGHTVTFHARPGATSFLRMCS